MIKLAGSKSLLMLLESVARVEDIVEQMDKRLNHIETELRDFRKEVFSKISSLRREQNTRFYWLIRTQISMWNNNNINNTG